MNTTTSQTKSYTDSSTQFAFQAPASRQVFLAGDFNNWDPKTVPMHKGPDGTWRVNVPLKPGRYEYRFYADGVWRDDPAAQQRSLTPSGNNYISRNETNFACRNKPLRVHSANLISVSISGESQV